MAIPNWNTNDVPSADDFDQWFTPRAKVKSADTTRTATTTLADDPHLAGLSVEANATFKYELVVRCSSPAAADIKFLITGPAGFDYQGAIWNAAISGAANMFAGTSIGPSTSGGTGTNDDRMYAIGYLTTAGTAGSLTLQWAQVTSDAGNTILKAGTILQITRVS